MTCIRIERSHKGHGLKNTFHSWDCFILILFFLELSRDSLSLDKVRWIAVETAWSVERLALHADCSQRTVLQGGCP